MSKNIALMILFSILIIIAIFLVNTWRIRQCFNQNMTYDSLTGDCVLIKER